MYIYCAVPISARAPFAHFVDCHLSAVEDWRLVQYEPEDSINFGSSEIHFITGQISVANPMKFLDPDYGDSFFYDAVSYDGMDLWVFDLNPYRLLDEVVNCAEYIRALGGQIAFHIDGPKAIGLREAPVTLKK